LSQLVEETLAEGSPEGLLAAALQDAARGVPQALAPRLALEAIPRVDRRASRAALATICLLEAADRAEASVHGLAQGLAAAEGQNGNAPPSRRFTPSGGSPQGDTAMGLAGAWLRARATELAAGLGAAPLRELAGAMRLMAEGWRREAEDLYDAGRTPERCLETAQQRGGSLGALAACLNAVVEESANQVEPLRRFGTAVGTAALIRDDIRALTASGETNPLQRGVYSLPVAYALEAEPKLATRIGGAIGDDAVAEIVGAVEAAGGIERAEQESAQLATQAAEAIRGLDGHEGLVSLAEEIAAPVGEVTA
jgi:hypothetical protein